MGHKFNILCQSRTFLKPILLHGHPSFLSVVQQNDILLPLPVAESLFAC